MYYIMYVLYNTYIDIIVSVDETTSIKLTTKSAKMLPKQHGNFPCTSLL